jgi:thymidylate synthase ThyX
VRHLSVSLDIAALLRDDGFAQRARETLERYRRPGAVLIPAHAATAALEALVRGVWDDVPVHAIPLGALPGLVREVVAAADHVLIVDDVVISGQTLFGLRARVYDVSQAIGRGIRVWGFVPVARPPSLQEWRRLRQRYMYVSDNGLEHSLHCAQELELPPPGTGHCPWCREHVLLQRTFEALEGLALDRARERETVLRSTPLMPPLTPGGVSDELASIEAIVGDLRPRAAFAAMAAQGQHIKNWLNSHRQVAELVYFDVELLLSAVFDAAMFGGLMRTLDARNVRARPARSTWPLPCRARSGLPGCWPNSRSRPPRANCRLPASCGTSKAPTMTGFSGCSGRWRSGPEDGTDPAIMPPVISPVEDFSAAERERLRSHFSNLDEPVFALVGLPETVKAALFARYSRYPGTLRRLFLDEFADDVAPISSRAGTGEGARAGALFQRVFVGDGDDSVAQLGGAHIACEYVSNIMTKVLERPRLGAYLEQSTRYIAYDAPVRGFGYRYYRDPQLGRGYEEAMEFLFETYAAILPRVEAWAHERFQARAEDPPAAHARAVRAKTLDLIRGVLPAASLSHVGIFATGQSYEQLILHLLAHPLPEAQRYGRMVLEAVRAVIPSFVARVDGADRGGAWVEYLQRREATTRDIADRLGLRASAEDRDTPSVRLLRVAGDERDALAALVFEASALGEAETLAGLDDLAEHERAVLFARLMGDRTNRRHRPGRGLETLHYRFEIVSDYGAFRDLQRHRMLTVQWQVLRSRTRSRRPRGVGRRRRWRRLPSRARAFGRCL